MNFQTIRLLRYSCAYQITRVVPFAAWVLVAAGGTVLFGFWPGVLAFLILWIFPLFWFSIWFRSLAWRASQSAIALYRHMHSRAAWLFLLFAVAGLSWEWELIFGREIALAKPSVAVLLAGLLLAVLFAMYQARKRVVIQPFIDFTVANKEQGEGEAIASRLRGEMAAITELYKLINEMSAPHTKSVIDATVTVEDVGEVLKEAIGPDSKISVSGLQIPLRAVIGPFTWLARGPRLTGSLHKEGEELLLVAELHGGGLSGSWRVRSSNRDDDGWDPDLPGWRQTVSSSSLGSYAVPTLTRQLAYRIVTDLVNLGSRRWRAVRQYTDGLRAYRDTRSTRREDKLLQAERAFVRALSHDDQFGQCHHNLGIVYRDVGKLEAARTAFQRALQANPSSFEAAYALAKDHFDHGRFGDALHWCNAAIRIDAYDARAWKLKGWTMRRKEESRHGASLPIATGKWPAIVQTRDIAAALAWRTLCRRAAEPDWDGQKNWITAAATLNSGIGHCLAGERLRAWRRFRQMVRLARDQPVLRFEASKTWCQTGDWKQGKRQLELLCWEELVPADQAALHLYRLSADDVERQLEPWSQAGEKQRSEQRHLLDLVVALQDGQGAIDRMNWIEDVESIRNAQSELLKKRAEEGKDSFIDSVEVAWYLIAGLKRYESENAEACAARLAALDQKLKEQRKEILADLSYLPGLGDHLSLSREDAPTDRSESASDRQSRLLKQAARGLVDLDWFQAQVKVRLSQERLDEMIVPALRAQLAELARQDLHRAIDDLNRSGHELQVGKQGLYSLLAEAYLVMAANAGDSTAERTRRTSLLNLAMEYAEKAVSREPEGIRQRNALGRAHAAFEDYMQAEHELTTSLQFRHTASAAVSLAKVCWNRGSCLSDPESRRLDLGLTRRTLDTALRVAEVGQEELQVQVHGGIHFLLGRLYCDTSTPTAPVHSHGGSLIRIESGSNCDNAVYHQKIALSMGYKPIESRLLLGWTYFDNGKYRQAGEMFRHAVGKALSFFERPRLAGARGQHDEGRYPAHAPGEDRPINELLAEALLGQALVYAERDTHLRVAWLLNRRALRLLRHVERRDRRQELRSLYQECKGWILFRRHNLTRSAAALRRAAALHDSVRVDNRLAEVSSLAKSEGLNPR